MNTCRQSQGISQSIIIALTNLFQSFGRQQWCPHTQNNAPDVTLVKAHCNQVSFLQGACTMWRNSNSKVDSQEIADCITKGLEKTLFKMCKAFTCQMVDNKTIFS